MHIPKCGGTSIFNGVSKHYRTDKIFRLNGPASTKANRILFPQGIIQEYRLGLLMYALFSQKYHLVFGHFYFSELAFEQFCRSWRFITVVRDPVNRFISHYFYDRFNNIDHHTIHEDLEDYLTKPAAKSLGSLMVKYFSGNPKGADIEKAKRNIEMFSLIGDIDNIKLFSETFHNYFGKNINVKKINKNPIDSGNQKKHLTPSVMDKINELCQPDIELFKHIKNKSQHMGL